MKPTAEWLQEYAEKRSFLKPLSDLNSYFRDEKVAEQKVEVFSIGKVNFPTGEILVRDPLVFLDAHEEPYFQTVPSGVYDLKICAVVDDDCARYAAAMVAFSDKEPVKYTEALLGNEILDDITEGDYFGFNVDAGLATIMDVKTRDAYAKFEKEWYEKNKDKNIYDDFFSRIFDQSSKDHPEFQREGGDWINWTIPGTDLSVPMFQSGFGDGVYPVYMGFDADGKVCRAVIQFIDISLAYSDDNGETE